jgi:hypothetical protein
MAVLYTDIELCGSLAPFVKTMWSMHKSPTQARSRLGKCTRHVAESRDCLEPWDEYIFYEASPGCRTFRGLCEPRLLRRSLWVFLAVGLRVSEMLHCPASWMQVWVANRSVLKMTASLQLLTTFVFCFTTSQYEIYAHTPRQHPTGQKAVVWFSGVTFVGFGECEIYNLCICNLTARVIRWMLVFSLTFTQPHYFTSQSQTSTQEIPFPSSLHVGVTTVTFVGF